MESEILENEVGPIVATVENEREQELERLLAEAEATIAQLKAAAAAPVQAGRKTVSVAMASLLAKQGVAGDSIAKLEAGALARTLDGALASLSIEQRIAVKSELLRAGILG
jgi:hypothetical protein